MMTETKAGALDLSEPRLAPLRRDDLASFLVDAASATILAATTAAARFGIVAGQAAPEAVVEVSEAVAGARPSALVRLRLPGSLTPLLFRCQKLEIAGIEALLFADPAALADAPALAVEGEPMPRVAGPISGLAPEDAAQRFTFETDAADRLLTLSSALANALGAEAAAWIGATFSELEADGRIVSGAAAAAALAHGTSFSGVRVTVPAPAPLELELGGVPLFDAARRRVATRGFGILRRWRPTPAAVSAFDVAPDAGVFPPPTPATTNVVPFAAGLSPRDASTFHEIGRTLTAAIGAAVQPDGDGAAMPAAGATGEQDVGAPEMPADGGLAAPIAELLDALPLATLLEDEDELVHANHTFLQWTGWPDVEAVRAAGGVAQALETGPEGGSQLMTMTGERLPVDARSVTAPFLSPDARLHVLRRLDRDRAAAIRLPETLDPRRAALDLVPWPLLLLDGTRHIRFANQAASDRLGFPAEDLEGEPFTLAIAPAMRPEAVTWLDRASASAPGEALNPMELRLRDREGAEFSTIAGLAAVGADGAQLCLVLGPAPRRPALVPERSPAPETATEPGATPPIEGAPAEEPMAAAGNPPPEALEPALHLVARRLAESLGPAFSTLTEFTPDEAAFPDSVRAALASVQQCLDDLAGLALPLAEGEKVPTAPAPLLAAALAHIQPAARRRRLAVRTDIDEVPPVLSRPARLARLMRVMLEEALDAAPTDSAIVVSLLCDELDPDAPVRLQVSDAGAAVDEVAEADAGAPLAPSAGDDRFSRAGRPLRLARLMAEAEALGGRFELVRGMTRGMTAQLLLPR